MLHKKKYVNNLFGAYMLVYRNQLLWGQLHTQVSSNTSMQSKRRVATPVMFIHYLRLHIGGPGENAALFTSICVHVAVALPTSSKPMSQL